MNKGLFNDLAISLLSKYPTDICTFDHKHTHITMLCIAILLVIGKSRKKFPFKIKWINTFGFTYIMKYHVAIKINNNQNNNMHESYEHNIKQKIFTKSIHSIISCI